VNELEGFRDLDATHSGGDRPRPRSRSSGGKRNRRVSKRCRSKRLENERPETRTNLKNVSSEVSTTGEDGALFKELTGIVRGVGVSKERRKELNSPRVERVEIEAYLDQGSSNFLDSTALQSRN